MIYIFYYNLKTTLKYLIFLASRAYYVTIGLIIRKHPVVHQNSAIFTTLTMKLQQEIRNKNWVVVDGIIACIADCLVHIQPDNEAHFYEETYKNLKKLLELDNREKSFQRSNDITNVE